MTPVFKENIIWCRDGIKPGEELRVAKAKVLCETCGRRKKWERIPGSERVIARRTAQPINLTEVLKIAETHDEKFHGGKGQIKVVMNLERAR